MGDLLICMRARVAVCVWPLGACAARSCAMPGSAPRGEVITYPDGHFANDSGERVVRDQLAFLTRHVPVVSASGEDSDV